MVLGKARFFNPWLERVSCQKVGIVFCTGTILPRMKIISNTMANSTISPFYHILKDSAGLVEERERVRDGFGVFWLSLSVPSCRSVSVER